MRTRIPRDNSNRSKTPNTEPVVAPAVIVADPADTAVATAAASSATAAVATVAAVTGTEPCFQFYLGGKAFGLPAVEVIEVRVTPPLAEVHGPDFVIGVVNIRGTVIPVLDLRAKLDLKPDIGTAEVSACADARTEACTEAGASTGSHLVVLRIAGKDAGMLVDGINLRLQEGVATAMSVVFVDRELPRFLLTDLINKDEMIALERFLANY